MVLLTRRILSLFLFLGLYAVSVLAASFEEQESTMRQIARLQLEGQHTREGQVFSVTDSNIPIPSQVENFESRASELAKVGSGPVGTVVRHTAKNSSFKKQQPVKYVYFYSLIQPDDNLGRHWGLEPDKMATILWRYHPKHGERIVQIDKIKRRPMDWHLELLQDILGRHNINVRLR